MIDTDIDNMIYSNNNDYSLMGQYLADLVIHTND